MDRRTRRDVANGLLVLGLGMFFGAVVSWALIDQRSDAAPWLALASSAVCVASQWLR